MQSNSSKQEVLPLTKLTPVKTIEDQSAQFSQDLGFVFRVDTHNTVLRDTLLQPGLYTLQVTVTHTLLSRWNEELDLLPLQFKVQVRRPRQYRII